MLKDQRGEFFSQNKVAQLDLKVEIKLDFEVWRRQKRVTVTNKGDKQITANKLSSAFAIAEMC